MKDKNPAKCLIFVKKYMYFSHMVVWLPSKFQFNFFILLKFFLYRELNKQLGE